MRQHRPWPLLVLLVWRQFWGIHCGLIRPIPELPDVKYSRPGDLNLGIVVSLHWNQPGVLCGSTLKSMGSFQRMEAMVFAVEEINNRTDILTNTSLGFVIVDDCGNELNALSRGLQFIQRPPTDSSISQMSWNESLPRYSAVAVIGAESSESTLQLADLFNVFKVPLLSYMASSSMLDGRYQFSYFSRIVPSDNLQAEAIVDILHTFGWTYVSLVHSKGKFGSNGVLAFQRYMAKVGICFALIEEVDASSDFQAVVKKLASKRQARVVILYLHDYHKEVFSAVAEAGWQNHFTFIGTDAMSETLSMYAGLHDVLHGSLALSFSSVFVDRFEQHFRRKTLKKESQSQNPWIPEFMAKTFGCSDATNCDQDKELGTSAQYKPERTVSLAFDSVYVLAYALDDLLKTCTEADVKKCVKPRELRDSLRRAKVHEENHFLGFDEDGNGNTSYVIQNFVRDNTDLKEVTVGEWDPAIRSFTYFNKDQIQFKAANTTRGDPDNATTVPRSVCSEACSAGHQVVVILLECCFYCKKCLANERTVQDSLKRSRCHRCPSEDNFTWPDEETRTKCLPLEAGYRLDPDRKQGLFILSLDVFVFVLTLIVTIVFIKNRNHHVIEASNKVMSAVILAGHTLTCCLVLVFLLRPSDLRCAVNAFVYPLTYTMSYAPLLVKTKRIYRSFLTQTNMVSTFDIASIRARLTVVTALILTQMVVLSISLIAVPPGFNLQMSSVYVPVVEAHCLYSVTTAVLGDTYNLGLLLACAVLAFKVRHYPGNFYEGRLTLFCVMTTLLWWTINASSQSTTFMEGFRTMIGAITMLMVTLTVLGFVFVPKLYAVYYMSASEEEASRNIMFMSTTTGARQSSSVHPLANRPLCASSASKSRSRSTSNMAALPNGGDNKLDEKKLSYAFWWLFFLA